MFDEDDYERLQPTSPARRAGSRARGRLALKLLLRRLDWMRGTLVYWTGEPLPSASVGIATRVVQQRLRSEPPGAYAVRMHAGKLPTVAHPFNNFLAALSPTIDDVIPVDLSLIARSLRRLQEARRFPVLLPQAVGDVSTWMLQCEEVLRRTRSLLDALSQGDIAGIGRAALVIGTSDAMATSQPATETPARKPEPKSRRRPTSSQMSPAPEITTGSTSPVVSKLFNAWPRDVLQAATRLADTRSLETLARRVPSANSAAVAAAVRDRLLFAPASVEVFLNELPALVALADRLADEPVKRLHAAIAIQRSALEAAVTQSGVSGNPLRYKGKLGTASNLALQRFQHYYDAQVSEELTQWFDPLPLAMPDPPAESGLDSADPLRFLNSLLRADRLRGHLLPRTRGKSDQQVLRWKLIAGKPGLLIIGEKEPLTFESLPAMAARSLWTSTRRPKDPFPIETVLSLGAIEAISFHDRVPNWIEWCSHAWPIGPSHQEHYEATLIALCAARAHAPSEQRHEIISAIDALAIPLLSHIAPSGHPSDKQSLFDLVQLVVKALVAGLSIEQVARYLSSGRTGALKQFMAFAPGQIVKFTEWLDDWTDRVTQDAATPHLRTSLLKAWSFDSFGCTTWANAYLLCGSDLLSRLLKTLIACGLESTQIPAVIESLSEFVNHQPSSLRYATALPPSEVMTFAREVLSEAMPVLRSALRRAAIQKPTRIDQARIAFSQCLDCARRALEDDVAARPAAVAALAAACIAELRRRRNDSGFDGHLFASSSDSGTETLVAIARRSPQRLITLGLATFDLNWSQYEQIAEAWRQIQRTEPLAEALSLAATRDNRTARTLRLLARLGLSFRLSGGEAFRAELTALAAGPAADQPLPAEWAHLAEPLTAIQRSQLAELLHWRLDGQLPERLRQTLYRPEAMARELALLREQPDLKPAARRRCEHLEQLLGDPAALAAWLRRDIDKHLPSALDDARLDRLEQRVAASVASHFATILSRPVPPSRNPREERNWDNALRLYFSADGNRALLRRLLAHELEGDRTWIPRQPQNARFLTQARARGIDTDAWLAPLSRNIESKSGPLRIEIETDPLHVLQMGNYFDTCLSEGDFNSFSTIANAVEVNKRVIYVYDRRDVVVGRKLVVLTREGALVGFRTYGKLPTPPNREAGDSWEELKDLLDAFCRTLAIRCGATLHPCTAMSVPPELREAKPLALFAKWYNDGPEPFGGKWLKGRTSRQSRRDTKNRSKRPANSSRS
ncbi:hypothetical protein [Humisphaera borealis]|uniref:Uncharacterized protein n=1 Tax=Humisphaera borealis TaxID=2807512 RepID=A0A7M2WQN0_9BACT|nr:hypothetical protein [Humisphaera borealis]QOV87855.1 hypothetical protein IPV69_16385 [Humisphaera borealis]